MVAPVGRNGVEQLLEVVADASDKRLPEIARACLVALGTQLRTLRVQILNFDRQIMAWHRSNEASKRLDEIPGVGPALATALVASVADPKAPVHGGRASCHPLCQDPWDQTSALACGIVGAAAHQGRCDRARQQDRKNGVGHDGQR